jgi:hypothetical protein
VFPLCRASEPAGGPFSPRAKTPVRKDRGRAAWARPDHPRRSPWLTRGTPTKKANRYPMVAKESQAQGLAGPLIEPQGDKEPEGREELQARQTKKDHQETADGRLERKGDGLDEGHPDRPLEPCPPPPGPLPGPGPRQAHGDEGDVEGVVGHVLQHGRRGRHQARAHQDQAQNPADQAAGKKHPLENGHLGPEEHPRQKHQAEEAEQQRRLERERALHASPPVTFGVERDRSRTP